ncbi:MAG: hypothetical protein J1E79_00515 [Rikenella sp.]|nr:hypothetical protein [Rikenella sp.]
MKNVKVAVLTLSAAALGAAGLQIDRLTRNTEPLSELTLANLEALATDIEEGENIGGKARWTITQDKEIKICEAGGEELCTF